MNKENMHINVTKFNEIIFKFIIHDNNKNRMGRQTDHG